MSFVIDDRIHKRIIEKKKKLDKLIKNISPEIIRNIEKEMQIEFVYNSNSIEGNTLTRGETELALRGITVKGKNIMEILEVQNHPNALKLIKDLSFDQKYRITEDDIKTIHKIIMNGVIGTAGSYRQSQIHIQGANFIPPAFYDIEDQMKDLVSFINNNPDELRPIELASYTHHAISWIHPFDDGNGRIARLLLNFILFQNGYRFVVIRKVDRKKYLDCLSKADVGNSEPFVNFIARCEEQTLDIYLLALESSSNNKNKNNKKSDMDSKTKLMTLSQLSKHTPYSSEYLSLLARKGVLDAIKEGKTWKTTRKVIDEYVKQHKKR